MSTTWLCRNPRNISKRPSCLDYRKVSGASSYYAIREQWQAQVFSWIGGLDDTKPRTTSWGMCSQAWPMRVPIRPGWILFTVSLHRCEIAFYIAYSCSQTNAFAPITTQIFTPVEDPSLKEELEEILDICLSDPRLGWDLGVDGLYRLDTTTPDSSGTHQRLIERTKRFARKQKKKEFKKTDGQLATPRYLANSHTSCFIFWICLCSLYIYILCTKACFGW